MGSPDKAKAWRLNPEDTPCFYCALDRETAIAEVRPWRRARISVAKFISTSELNFVDLTGDVKSMKGPSLQWLSFILGRPVHPGGTEESYLPSQLLAEKCRAAGFNGVLYNSSLKQGGVNAAIFMGKALKCQDVELH